MKKKIIRIGIPVLLVVAALTAFIMHLIGNRATYVKDVSPEELQAAFDLLNESYLAKGESPETFYVDFLAQHKDEAGKGEYVADVRAGCPADEFYETNSANEYRRQFVKDEKVTSMTMTCSRLKTTNQLCTK